MAVCCRVFAYPAVAAAWSNRLPRLLRSMSVSAPRARMVRALAIRIAWLFSVIVAVTAIVFVIVHLSGDPTDGFVDPGASPEVRERIRGQLGLDDPLAVQYLRFLGSAVTGDFGESWR